MNEPLTPDDLAALLKREFEAADSYHEQLEMLQRQAFEYYEAHPFGNEVTGQAQTVLPDVQETIDSANAALLKVFVSGDRTVEFEAVSEEDEQHAEDATAALDYNFQRKQDGYRVLGDVSNDGLLRKIGIFKASVVEDEKVSRQRIVIDPMQLGMLEGVEIEDVTETQGEDGAPMLRALIKQQRTETRYMIHAVPTNEFRFSPRARHEDTADYVAHVRTVTRSDLVEMGFDRDQVYSLPAHHEDWTRESESDTLDNLDYEESSPALQSVLLCEEYALIDVDGDGIAERVKCYRVENVILRWQGEEQTDEFGEPAVDEDGNPVMEPGEEAVETVDEQPFAVFCPFPRPHRLVGYSLADKVMDAQFVRSFVARQLFDGMANANLPRTYVDMTLASDETLDDLLNPIAGSPVRGNGPGAVTPLQNGFDVSKSLQVMEWVSREKEGRTGFGRASPTLDENSVNAQTATEFMGRQTQGENLQEMMARNLAEALGRAFAKQYRQMRIEAEPFSIRVDGKVRQVDPSQWPEDINMRVRVGLGSGSKDKRIQARMMLLEPITAAMQQGLSGPEHAFAWMDGMARDTGVGQGEDFMFDPSDPEVQQRMAQREEQPDPALVEAQGKLELEREKAGASAALDRDKAQASIETDRMKHQLDMQVMRERAKLEAELARDRAEFEARMARERFEFDKELAIAGQQREQEMRKNRPGGDLDK